MPRPATSTTMEAAYMEDWRDVCQNLDVDPDQGLDQEQVDDGLAKYGPNGECGIIEILCRTST